MVGREWYDEGGRVKVVGMGGSEKVCRGWWEEGGRVRVVG